MPEKEARQRLVARREAHDAEDAAARVLRMLERGAIVAEDGTEIETAADSICVHGDEPTAVATAARVRAALEEAGYAIAPFAPPTHGA